jgi:hypothetical protein
MIFTLRPCLVLDAVQRRHAAQAGDSAPVVPKETLSLLDDTCLFCGSVARHLIHLFEKAIDSNPLISVCTLPPSFIISSPVMALST